MEHRLEEQKQDDICADELCEVFLVPQNEPIRILAVNADTMFVKYLQKKYTGARIAFLAGSTVFAGASSAENGLLYQRQSFDCFIFGARQQLLQDFSAILSRLCVYLKREGMILARFENSGYWKNTQKHGARGFFYEEIAAILKTAGLHDVSFAIEQKTYDMDIPAQVKETDAAAGARYWLVKAAYVSDAARLLRKRLSEDKRWRLSFFLHRMAYGIQAEENAADAYLFCRRNQLSTDELALFIEEAVILKNKVFLLLALQSSLRGDFPYAGRLLLSALQYHPQDDELLYALLLILRQSGRFRELEALLTSYDGKKSEILAIREELAAYGCQ